MMEQQAIMQSVQSAFADLGQCLANIDVGDKEVKVMIYQNVVLPQPKDTLSLSEFAQYKGWAIDKAREWLDKNPRYEVLFNNDFSVKTKGKKKLGNKSRTREVNLLLYRQDLINPPITY